MKTRILLAEDNTLLRQKTKEVLSRDPEFDVIAETGSGSETIAFALRHRPDVAIIASDLREVRGIEATTRILAYLPDTIVIILSMNDDERYLDQAWRAGARGYVLKNQAGDTLIGVIRRAQRGTLRTRSAG